MAEESEIEALYLPTGYPILEYWYSSLRDVLKKINAEAKAHLERVYEFNGILIRMNHFLPPGLFEELTYLNGYVDYKSGYVKLGSGDLANGYAIIAKDGGYPYASWDKDRRVTFEAEFNSNANQVAWLVSGDIDGRRIGFKVEDDTLYGVVHDGTNIETLNLGTITPAKTYRLEAVLTAGIECRFFVDGEDKGALITYLPTGTTNASRLIHAKMKTKDDVDRAVVIRRIKLYQAP